MVHRDQNHQGAEYDYQRTANRLSYFLFGCDWGLSRLKNGAQNLPKAPCTARSYRENHRFLQGSTYRLQVFDW
jgi:hypothetical protein